MEEEDGRGAGRLPGLQLRAHLPARRVAAPGRRGDQRAARAGRALLRPPAPASPTTAGSALESSDVVAGSEEAVRAAVTYVAGMTDRFAFRQAVALLGWDPAKLPAGVDG